MDQHRHLSSPLRLGPVTVANRIVFAAHLTNHAEDGRPTGRSAGYLAARAAGGAGLVVTEEVIVSAGDRPYEKLVAGADPAVVPALRRLTDAVHVAGVPVFAQLNHNGGQSSSRYTRTPVQAPSPVPDPLFGEVPQALSTAGIAALVAGYATTAGHCAAGGFDGVELQCSQSSLVRGFLARLTNRRTDGWGGPLAQRARFLLAVVAAVREAIGPARALGVRLSVDDLVAGGITPQEAVATARLVAATGAVDYLSTSVGVATETLHRNVAAMGTAAGWTLPVAARIRRATGLPVVGVGGFTTPAEAEAALASGRCDLVGVVRGQIADPEFAVKARTGRSHEIRSCLRCNQECIGRVGRNLPLACVVNPRAGRESELPAPRRRSRRVAVVGGGPAVPPAGRRRGGRPGAPGHPLRGRLPDRRAGPGGCRGSRPRPAGVAGRRPGRRVRPARGPGADLDPRGRRAARAHRTGRRGAGHRCPPGPPGVGRGQRPGGGRARRPHPPRAPGR